MIWFGIKKKYEHLIQKSYKYSINSFYNWRNNIYPVSANYRVCCIYFRKYMRKENPSDLHIQFSPRMMATYSEQRYFFHLYWKNSRNTSWTELYMVIMDMDNTICRSLSPPSRPSTNTWMKRICNGIIISIYT